MATTNHSFPVCLFRTDTFLTVLASFAEDREFRLLATIPAAVLSPLIVCSNGLVLVSIVRATLPIKTSTISLICCLLCSDCLVGMVFLPLYATWTMKDHALRSCAITGSLLFVGWFITTISFLTIIAVSCDRYIALFHSFNYKSIVTSTRTKKLIFAICLFSAVQSSMSLHHYLALAQYVLLGCLLVFGLFVLVFAYTRIFKLVRHHHRQINSHQVVQNDRTRQTKLAITMSYVIGVTLLCYMPFGIALAVLLVQGKFSNTSFKFFHISELFFCISSLCNPVIYCIRNLEIRTAVVVLIRDMNLFDDTKQNDHHKPTSPATITLKKDPTPAQSAVMVEIS
ncbi:adrenocorticotropic hormone receptor [Exaiptasia diaphana]|uniref:G-protein coupled receptors family 1 profile domain-containing protein n=1 Tax=Exaiptasia diaphana TaxID=2652724 RepID=A0A913Z003_EXADI|nr:adrenocorticotropic hormone receptor [Exaiptasia diaphana]